MGKELANINEPFNTRTVVKTLETLMNRVTEKECTPQTVVAACQCAERITDILKVHLEVAKISRISREEK